ncbi:MAG: transcriptional regulator [Solirubrobacteraceae bacterium]
MANSRFTVSALAETVAALIALAGRRRPSPGLEDWVRTHRPDYRIRIAADPVAAALIDAALRPPRIADLLARPPHPTDRTFHDELRRLRMTPLTQAQRDLAVDGHLHADLRTPDVVDRAADLLEWVWTQTVRADWTRRRHIFEADIVSRTRRLSSGGWVAAIDGMRHGMRWLGDGRLQINAYDNPPRTIVGADLMFVPSTTPRGWAAWDEPHRYAIVYPWGGLLADELDPSPPDSVAKLIGPVRANILAQLVEPRSTTQLVALTGYGLGSVG